MMRARWIAATLGALALALLTLDTSELWGPSTLAAGGVCPAEAKHANLNFTLKDMDGRSVRLADYKGKVLILDFWATWCGPCKVEIPWFVEFQKKYGPSGLQVIGVSVDDTVEMLRPFVKEFKMNYPVLQGRNHDDIQNAYGPLWGIPVTAVISRDARICVKHSGIASSKENLEKEIKSLL